MHKYARTTTFVLLAVFALSCTSAQTQMANDHRECRDYEAVLRRVFDGPYTCSMLQGWGYCQNPTVEWSDNGARFARITRAVCADTCHSMALEDTCDYFCRDNEGLLRDIHENAIRVGNSEYQFFADASCDEAIERFKGENSGVEALAVAVACGGSANLKCASNGILDTVFGKAKDEQIAASSEAFGTTWPKVQGAVNLLIEDTQQTKDELQARQDDILIDANPDYEDWGSMRMLERVNHLSLSLEGEFIDSGLRGLSERLETKADSVVKAAADAVAHATTF